MAEFKDEARTCFGARVHNILKVDWQLDGKIAEQTV